MAKIEAKVKQEFGLLYRVKLSDRRPELQQQYGTEPLIIYGLSQSDRTAICGKNEWMGYECFSLDDLEKLS